MTAGQLALLLHLDPGTISASLNRLESKRLVKRQRDSHDRRRVSLLLTHQGRKLDRPASGTVERAVEQLLATTPARSVASMVTVIDRFTAMLDAQLLARGVRTLSADAVAE